MEESPSWLAMVKPHEDRAFDKGRDEGRDEGRRTTLQQQLLKLLRWRFQAIGASLEQTILATQDVATLERAAELAYEINSPDELRLD